jgi:hypothetical protein
MAYAYVQDINGGDWETYEKVVAELGDAHPDGLIVHTAGLTDTGVRFIDVWESKEAWERFFTDTLAPARERAGGPSDTSQVSFQILDVQHVMR